jgi:hypothetical protein
VPGGGTDLASSYVRQVLEWARQSQLTVAVLFTDIGAAFYSCLTEEAVGCILASPRRAAALAKLGFSEAEAAEFAARVEASPAGLARGGLAPGWVALLADWHRFCWFTTRLDGVKVMTVFGARPGDPLADLIFGVCYAVVQLEIRQSLLDADLMPHILVRRRPSNSSRFTTWTTRLSRSAYRLLPTSWCGWPAWRGSTAACAGGTAWR